MRRRAWAKSSDDFVVTVASVYADVAKIEDAKWTVLRLVKLTRQ